MTKTERYVLTALLVLCYVLLALAVGLLVRGLLFGV